MVKPIGHVGSPSTITSVSLAAGATIAGTVTVGGNPASGATVVATSQTNGAQETAESAADGSYAITGLPGDTYDLSTFAPDNAPSLLQGVVVAAGGSVTENPTLAVGSPLTVSADPHSAGASIPGSTVSLVDPAGVTVAQRQLGPATSTNDPADTVTLGNIESGAFTLVVTGFGRPTLDLPVTSDAMRFTVPAGEGFEAAGSGAYSAGVSSNVRRAAVRTVPATTTSGAVGDVPSAGSGSLPAGAGPLDLVAHNGSNGQPAPLQVSDLLAAFLGNTLANPPPQSPNQAALEARYSRDPRPHERVR